MNKKYLLYSIYFGLIISTLFYGLYFKGSFDDDFKKSFQLKVLKSHVINNNLTIIDEQIIGSNEWFSEQDLDIWYEYVKQEYHYSQNEYDCKYWAMVWALYFEKHNIDYKLIDSKTHIFVIAEYSDKYCLADGNILNCYNFVK